MADVKVLLEFPAQVQNPFELSISATESDAVSHSLALSYLDQLGGMGIELDAAAVPVPMFSSMSDGGLVTSSEGFASEMAVSAVTPNRLPRLEASSVVVSVEVSEARLADLLGQTDVIVWPNSPLTLFQTVPLAAAGSVDCRPFQPGVSLDVIRRRLGARTIWSRGFRGQNIIVGIIDEGVNGATYPVIGGHSRPGAGLRPGEAAITSHGSMCAADILLAAPDAKLYDYPFLGIPNSGGALEMFQAVLTQRAIDGTPHITNNSYGFTGVPNRVQFPNHEIHNLNHPVHRKVREVVLAGVACFFAAGNCGQDCPSGNCHVSGIGPGKSIHASNSLDEVITVAAVNSKKQRIGYSSQGPGLFHPQKPDIAAYSHFFGNFGPDRPGGLDQPFDNGTSAATPVAAGVAATLLSAFPRLSPNDLKRVLMETAKDLGSVSGWDNDHGAGVISLSEAYKRLRP
jgi:serine protease AprX